ncbi:MAG: class I SAM-dependent methyltransferase, partial [Bdellovibrionales bacterium]|nr:class I SAM-dependent methyltransferase [Bdellovibrionales bacterium]
MIKELIEKIRLQFNSDERIEAMLQSYNLKPRDGTVEIDPFELLREELFIDLISNNHPKSLVLDVGCGFGHMVLNLQKAGIECKGIDISSSLISLGKELLISEGIDPNKLLEADLFEYDFKEKFCTIAACGVIWYYSDKRPFLKKLHSLLESSGKTVITHRNDLFNLFALNAG